MRNILIISCVFPPEPVVSAQLSYDIAIELAKNNNVTVLSPKPTRPQDFQFVTAYKEYPFKHIVLPSYTHPKSEVLGRMKESYSFGKKCTQFIRENKDSIDVIYINSWPLFSQSFILKAAKKYNIKTVIHIQDIYPESLVNKLPLGKSFIQSILLPIDRSILKTADKILCISDNMLDILSSTREIAKSKFTTVTNWQNEERFIAFQNSQKHNVEKEKPFTFMYLGNNGPVAGVEFLIESFVMANIANTQLTIAGSGSKTEDCRTLANNVGAKNIHFLPVPDGEVPAIQDMADVMVLPVKKGAAMSSIPSKLPAYMFSKKPIIGSLDLLSDTAKAIIDANAGLVVEPEDKEKLASAMREISGWSTEKAKEIGQNGFDYSMIHFSKRENLRKVIDVILNI